METGTLTQALYKIANMPQNLAICNNSETRKLTICLIECQDIVPDFLRAYIF